MSHDPLQLEIVDLRHQAAQWREVAETLWEELQEWHYDDCSFANPSPLGPTECICHRILATTFAAAVQESSSGRPQRVASSAAEDWLQP